MLCQIGIVVSFVMISPSIAALTLFEVTHLETNTVLSCVQTDLCRITMSGKVSDLPIRSKRALFTQRKLDRINFRSDKRGGVLRNPPGVTRCWSPAWPQDSLSHGIDKMADPVIVSIFGVQLLMFVKVVVTFMHVRQVSVLPSGVDVRKLQRSHSELSRVEPLSGLPSRLFFGLPIRFTYPV